ncbi:MAG: alpha/beta fold hydrolase, partial [Candidatus Riflebacteria bacterium]|nr:alpha/beta fold hydrolase [Candidatus Riflebacteria bacterium]
MPFVSVNGCQIYYQDVGRGDPVVLVHGWPVSSLYWNNVIPDLARRRRVLALDLKGFGRSDRPNCKAYRIADLADDLAGFLDELGIASADLVGHSLGGMTSLFLALSHPRKVRRLVAVAAPVHGPSSLFWYLKPAAIPGIRTLVYTFSLVQLARRVVGKVFTNGKPVPQDLLEEVGCVSYRCAVESQKS